MSTAYVLRIAQPEARRAEISLDADTRGAASMEVRLPVWTPGSYLIREHQRHVDGLRATDQEGRALAVERVDKQTWRVASGGARRVRVDYRLACVELTVRTNHIDSTHAFLNLNDKGRGGLEHRRSCALLVPRFAFVQKSAYEDFLLLAAHEYFHLWNVKRIRPAAFTPYDWRRENYTRLLWAMEGLTSTYEVLALRRAGIVTPQRFLEIWGERLTALSRTPGRLRTPLAQASYDAWIKHYRPDETTANTTVSYYLKGSVVGFLLDLEMRRRSGGKRSLDDLVRLLFERHGRAPGLPEEGVEKAALDLVPDLAPWFERAVRSTQELELDAALAGVGLRAVVRAATGADDKGGAEQEPKPAATNGGPRSWFGAQVKDKGGALEVQSVVEGSPAQQAGIGRGDEIVAIAGFRTDLKQRLGRALPGQELRVTLFRM